MFFVGIFSKRKSENLDFVELAKRGVLESVRQQERETGLPVGEDGVVDFTSEGSWGERPSATRGASSLGSTTPGQIQGVVAGTNTEGNQIGASGSSGSSSSGGMMGFLDDLAGAGSGSSANSSVAAPPAASSPPMSFWDDVPGAPATETVSAPSSSVSSLGSSSSSGVAHLQTKLEDLEYKLERLMEKISRMEEGLR